MRGVSDVFVQGLKSQEYADFSRLKPTPFCVNEGWEMGELYMQSSISTSIASEYFFVCLLMRSYNERRLASTTDPGDAKFRGCQSESLCPCRTNERSRKMGFSCSPRIF